MTDRSPDEDEILAYMRKGDIPITRENYLDLLFMGEVPEEISWEHELEIPEFLRRPFPGRGRIAAVLRTSTRG